MIPTQAIRLQNYELVCGASPDDSGRFNPTLVISKNVWPSRPRTIALQREAFSSPESAIQAAHAQGLAWVANWG